MGNGLREAEERSKNRGCWERNLDFMETGLWLRKQFAVCETMNVDMSYYCID